METRSFKFGHKLLVDLEKLAKENGTNLSELVRRVLENHVNFVSKLAQTKIIFWPLCFLEDIFDNLGDDILKTFAKKYAEDEMERHIISIEGEYTIDSYLKNLEGWAQSGALKYHVKDEEKEIKYSMEVQSTEKFALIIAEMIKISLDKLNANYKLERHKNVITFSIKK